MGGVGRLVVKRGSPWKAVAMSRILAFCFFSSVVCYNSVNMGGTIGCVVTKNKLFSNGNFIRELQAVELEQLTVYKKELASFTKKINEALENADLIASANATVPKMPVRPTVPPFCSGKDTTLFIFGGCTIQNHKVYIGKTFARELDAQEKKALDDFAQETARRQQDISPDLHQRLDFCMELS